MNGSAAVAFANVAGVPLHHRDEDRSGRERRRRAGVNRVMCVVRALLRRRR